jgi:hypothetical protein
MASYGFHAEAAEEYLAATQYYLDRASPLLAAAFVAEVEAAIQTVLNSPTTWAVIEEPKIRRLLAQAISLFNLLPLGVGVGPCVDLRSDAL